MLNAYTMSSGAVLTTLSIWGLLGFPTPATSTDIKRLDKAQATYAVELYSNKVRSLLVIPPPDNEPAKSIWRDEIEKAKRDRDAAEKRALELR